jgi:hypothetical protein
MGKVLGICEVDVDVKTIVVCIWREINLRHILSCDSVVGDYTTIRAI